ncbi:YhcB family protein [Rheinheimera texasensis]|jgi:hypothetical protein|uniref:YhcB family protein n=1 Tax=Rheinheimera texasensis TaxID=306205 RepID=UPI0004E22406|nr:YhcB family protein [Rheinheimera texasensis]
MLMSSILWLIAGLVIGAVAARLFSIRQFNQNKLQVELEESKTQLQNYRSEVSDHLETTQRLMSQLQDNYEQIVRHMASTKMTLVDKAPVQRATNLNYLSTDTAEHIRKSLGQIDERRRKQVSHSQQPLDYAGHSSGLMKTFPTEKNSDN